MVYSRYVQIGRVVFLPDGDHAGKLAVIVEVIDANRALLDGPKSGVPRHACGFKHMQLTKFLLPLRHGARAKTVGKAWDTAKLSELWQNSLWAKKLNARELRANMTDFDRFKLMKAKQARNRIVHLEYTRLRKSGKKTATGGAPAAKKPAAPKATVKKEKGAAVPAAKKEKAPPKGKGQQ